MSSARKTVQFQTGTIIDDRFEIVSHIGDGGMGAVYLARHVMLDRLVAIKFIPLVKPGGADPEKLFRAEAMLMAKLKHENIVSVIDSGILKKRDDEEDAIGYIAMEYVAGGSLRKRMIDGKLGRLFIASTLMQVASALKMAHAAKILHRDIKPENILVGEGGHILTTDFGNSRIMLQSKYKTQNPRPVGTLHYMPFEQLLNTGMDEKVDTYALGVMAYELFAGRHPRAKDGVMATHQEVMAPLLAQEPMPDIKTIVRDLPDSLSALINRAVAHEPADRPSAAEMEEVFRRYVKVLREVPALANGAGLAGLQATTVMEGSPPPGSPAGASSATPTPSSGPRGTMKIDAADIPGHLSGRQPSNPGAVDVTAATEAIDINRYAPPGLARVSPAHGTPQRSAVRATQLDPALVAQASAATPAAAAPPPGAARLTAEPTTDDGPDRPSWVRGFAVFAGFFLLTLAAFAALYFTGVVSPKKSPPPSNTSAPARSAK